MSDPDYSLSVSWHPSDIAGLTYIYPVVSRRAGGVSVGINLNTNHACNWRCAYCQVPDLQRGSAPPVDVVLLERELDQFLDHVLNGDFMQRHVPEDARILKDIAFSGDGEPTSAREFPAVIEAVGRVMQQHGLTGKIPLVVISNGSQLDKVRVRTALSRLAGLGGELWFKFDRATAEGMRQINGTRSLPSRHLDNLKMALTLCPVWVQTCMVAWDGEPPAEAELQAWLAAICPLAGQVRGVLLYGLARPSMQPQAPHLSALPAEWMQNLAARMRSCGLVVRLSV